MHAGWLKAKRLLRYSKYKYDKILGIFITKHNFTILLGIVLIAAGVYAALAIPKESSPEIQIPIGIITTILPGASSEDVERLITNKIEDRVLGVENVSKLPPLQATGFRLFLLSLPRRQTSTNLSNYLKTK